MSSLEFRVIFNKNKWHSMSEICFIFWQKFRFPDKQSSHKTRENYQRTDEPLFVLQYSVDEVNVECVSKEDVDGDFV